MKTVFFLLIVGLAVTLLVLAVWGAEKKYRAKIKARKKKLQNKAKLHFTHHPLASLSVRAHEASRHAYGLGAWEARQKRAQEEIRDGTSFAADRLFSDAEDSRERSEHSLSMGKIEYTPESPPKTRRSGN